MSFAPISLFVYNRPFHTKQVLDTLSANPEAKDSILYIFCDGAKAEAKENVLKLIIETRLIVKNENRFKEVVVKEHPRNKGLANSIIDGVTEVVNRYGSVIVLEDDLVVSPYFLFYMNDSLARYEKNNRVGQIGTCNFFACGSKYPSIPIPDCLGWATWKNRWNHFNPDAEQLLRQLEENGLMNKFNAYGSYDMKTMLVDQIGNLGTSWAVRWTAVCVINDWLSLYPNPSLTNHTESLNATHSNSEISPPMPEKRPAFVSVDVVEIPKVIKAMKRAYGGIGDYYGNLKSEYNSDILNRIFYAFVKDSTIIKWRKNNIKFHFMLNIKSMIKALLPPVLFSFIRKLRKQPVVEELWSGDYPSWKGASIICTGYDSALILEKCKNALMKVKNGEAVYERDSMLFDEIQYSWGLLAGLQRAALENDSRLCVLDFGGSLGSTYYQNKDFLSSVKEFKWCIVEQPHFVDCGKKYFENEQLKLYHTIEECLAVHKPNVLLLSGVLQYLEKPYEWIEKIINLDIPFIIIDRTAFVDGNRDILTVQKVPESIYKASYPAWFFSEGMPDRFEKKYKMVARFDNGFTGSAIINGVNRVYWNGIIFKK